MDIFWEDNVRRRDLAPLCTALQIMTLLGMIAGGIGIAAGFFSLMTRISVEGGLTIAGFAALIVVCRFISMWARMEYDYTLAGEELEIARLTGPNSRKSLLKINLSGASGAPAASGASAGNGGDRYILNSSGAQYAIEYNQEGERRRVILEPSGELIAQLARLSERFKTV